MEYFQNNGLFLDIQGVISASGHTDLLDFLSLIVHPWWNLKPSKRNSLLNFSERRLQLSDFVLMGNSSVLVENADLIKERKEKKKKE